MGKIQLLSVAHSRKIWKLCNSTKRYIHISAIVTHNSFTQRSVVQSLSCVWFFCDPMNCSLQGSSIHRISQGRILERVAISFSRGSSQPRDQICISCIGMRILYHWVTGKPYIQRKPVLNVISYLLLNIMYIHTHTHTHRSILRLFFQFNNILWPFFMTTWKICVIG